MADSKNAFAALEKENSASWNTASREALGPEKIGNPTIISDVKEKIKGLKEQNANKGIAIESAYNEILRDIKSTLNLGKKPKREDFINSLKKAEDIAKVLEDAVQADTILDAELIGYLQHFVGIAVDTLKKNVPGMVGAGAKAAGSKITSTVSGVISGMASQLTEGVPFAPEMLAFAGTKIKGAFGGRGTSSAQKEMAAKLQGGDEDDAEGEGPEPEPTPPGPTPPGPTPPGGNLGGEVVIGKLDNIAELLKEGFGLNSPPYLESIEEHLQFIRDNTETAETRRERLRDKGAAAGGLLKKRKMAGIPDEEDGGFWSNLLGSFLGAGGGTGMGGFFGGKGGRGNAPGSKATQFKKGWNKVPAKGVNPANLFKGPAFKTALSAMTIPLMGALTPLLGFLMSPPGLIALAAAATAGGLWWAGSKILEKKSSKDLTKELELIEAGVGTDVGRGKNQTELLKKARQDRIKRKKAEIAEAEKRESGESEGRWEWQGLGRQRKRVWIPAEGAPKRHEGGKIKGPPGFESMYKLTAGERVFDNESSERMERVAKILEGTNFKTLEEYMQAGKDTIGYKVLMNTFTEGMLESAGGATLERMARKFGLAQTGQLGTTEYLHTEVPKYAMSPETVLKMLGRVEKFSRRSRKYQGMAELVKKTRASGKEWEGGTINVKKGDKNLAMQTVMAIAKAMATIEDSPEEKAAAKRYRDLSDQGRDQEAMRMSDKEYLALNKNLAQSFAEKEIKMKLMFEQMDTKYTNFNKEMTLRDKTTGKTLNNAAMNKVGLNGGVGGGSPHVIDTSSTQVVNNTTIVPPIEPNGPALPFGYANARS